MYIPQYYKNENVKEVRQFIQDNGFGILVSQVNGKPWATHIPLELYVDSAGKDILVGHISKANPQWREFAAQPEVLCIFNGAHGYISPSWYKQEEVPTWNYIAVHVYGEIEILSEEEVLQSMQKLVDNHEKGSKHPISLDDFTPKTLRQVRGVVGFKITITDIQAAYKLSQTRPEDHSAIINGLNQRDGTDKSLAKEMEKQIP